MCKIRGLRTIVGLVIVGVLMCDVPAHAATNTINIGTQKQFSKILEEKRVQYANDEEFIKEAVSEKLSYNELLYQKARVAYENSLKDNKNSVEGGISLLAVGNNGKNVSANVPLIQQPTGNSCGPTSVLQALYALNKQGQVSGSTNANKINTLYQECYHAAWDTCPVYKITQCLNKYTSYKDYEYVVGTSMTISSFQTKVENSLYYDMAPILHSVTKPLPYYQGQEYYHYVVISEVDKANGTITIKDCNWRNEFFGTHKVSVEEAYKSITEYKDRYLICMAQ